MIKYFANAKKKFGTLPSINSLLYNKRPVHPQQKLVEMYADVYHSIPCSGCLNPLMYNDNTEIPNLPNPAIEGDSVRVYLSFDSAVEMHSYVYTGTGTYLVLYNPAGSGIDFTGQGVVDLLNKHFKGTFVFESKLGVPTLVSSIFDPADRVLSYFVLEFYYD